MPVVMSLVAYDCRAPGVSHPYLATTAQDCSKISVSTPTSAPRIGTFLQVPVKVANPARTCRLERISKRYYCTYSRYLNPVIDESMFRTFGSAPISVADCRAWWSTGEATGEWGTTKISDGETKIVLAHGLTTSDGWCNDWKSQIDIKAWRLTRSSMPLTAVYSENGQVSDYLLLEDTLVTPMGTGVGTTASGTAVLWSEADYQPCHLEHVYHGYFNSSTLADSSQWIFSEETGTAVQLGATESVCGASVVGTSEPFLFFRWGGNRRRSLGPRSPIGRVSTAASVRSNYLLVLLLQGDAATRGLSFESLCKMEAEIRRIHLTDAGVSPSQLAFRTFGATGHALYQAGSGFRLAPCPPVDVRIDPQPTCHSLIPVRRTSNDSLEFWDPSTKSLHATAQIIGCSDPSLPIFTLGGGGGVPHELSPTLRVIPNPGSLPTSVNQDARLPALPSRGLYDSHVLMDTDPRVTMVEAAKQRADVLSNSWEDLRSSGALAGASHPGDIAERAMRTTLWGQMGGTTLWLLALTVAVFSLWLRSSGRTIGLSCRVPGLTRRRSKTNSQLESELVAIRNASA